MLPNDYLVSEVSQIPVFILIRDRVTFSKFILKGRARENNVHETGYHGHSPTIGDIIQIRTDVDFS